MKITFTLALLDNIIKDIYFTWKFKGKNYPRPPQYPNSISTHKYKNPEFSKSRIITFTTTDGLEAVYNFYKKRLPKDGWEQKNTKMAEGKINFLYNHPKRVFSWPYPPKRSRHGKVSSFRGLDVYPWFSLSFRATPENNLLQVEIDYRILGSHDWPDDKF